MEYERCIALSAEQPAQDKEALSVQQLQRPGSHSGGS